MRALVPLVLAVCTVASTAASQGYTWIRNPSNGRLYAVTAPMTWWDAESEAQSFGGHLATVRNQAEQDWLTSQYPAERLWIGLNDFANEGQWTWSSGEPVNFTSWCPGEPSGSSPNEDAVEIGYYPGWCTGGWNDQDPNDLIRGIIERPDPDPRWRQLSPPTQPAARFGAVATYDPVRNRGIFAGSFLQRDVVEWDGQDWNVVRPSTSPVTFLSSVVAYDPATQRVVMPIVGSNRLDLWSWSGSAWSLLPATTRPPAMFGFMTASDTSRQRVVLHGNVGLFVSHTETWEWDGTNWSRNTTPTRPAARSGFALAFDPVRNETVMFGGKHLHGSLSVSNQTWVYDGTDWTLRTPSTQPPARHRHAMAWHAGMQSVVLFGGYNSQNAALNDTWLWDGTDWTDLQGAGAPPARADLSMFYEPAGDRIIVFGGISGGGAPLGDTWTLDAPPPTPTYAIYRQSCDSSAGTPTLRATSLPRIGHPFHLRVDQLPANTPGAILFSADDTTWRGFPLPYDLTLFGAPCCFANVDLDRAVLLAEGSDSNGLAHPTTFIPNRTQLLGITFFNQYVSFAAPAGRSLAITTTNAGRGTIGQ